MITDEMVDRAVQVWLENASDYTRLHVSMRAAIEAVAPMLIAQGMRKSAYIYRDWLAISDGGTFDKYLNFQANELEWRSKGEFIRAQELDPQ